jgi:hypothetical protein
MVSDGVSGSQSNLHQLAADIGAEVGSDGKYGTATWVNTRIGQTVGPGIVFGEFEEANYLAERFQQRSTDLWSGTYTLLNALQDVQTSTSDIAKNYSNADDTLTAQVRKDLSEPTAYLNQEVNQTKISGA